MSGHGEFGPVNSDNILWSLRPATLVTSEHSGHDDLGPNDCVSNTRGLMYVLLRMKHIFSPLLIDLVPH